MGQAPSCINTTASPTQQVSHLISPDLGNITCYALYTMSARYSFGEHPLWQEHALLDFLCDPAVLHKKIPLAKGYFTPSTSLLLAALNYTPYQPEWKVPFDPEHHIPLLGSILQDLKTISAACPARTANDSELADFLVSIKSRVSGMPSPYLSSLHPFSPLTYFLPVFYTLLFTTPLPFLSTRISNNRFAVSTL